MEPITIHYRVYKMSRLSYSIAEKPDGFKIDRDNCQFMLTLGLTRPSDFDGFILVCDIEGVDKDTHESLLEFRTASWFEVQKAKEVIKLEEDNTFSIPDGLLLDAISVAVGATRGMLVLSNAGTYLNDAVLPIFDSFKLLKALKDASPKKNSDAKDTDRLPAAS
jgi:hypothetical protein